MALISNTKTDKNTVVLEIEVGSEEFRPAVDRAYRKNAPKITIPGFRPGKAPRAMVEKTYGHAFVEEAVNELFPAAYEAAAKEADIDPVDRASVDITEVTDDGFKFIATVTVRPEVKLGKYKGLEAERREPAVEEAEVDSTLQSLRDRASRLVEVQDRAAADGDTANIDFEGFVDDVAFEGGKAEGFDLVLGSGQFIPGFEEQIVGKSIGDEFDVNVSFPEEYHADDLAGKPAVFKVKLHGLKAKEMPELDDEFAKDVSEFETLAELTDDIRARLLERNTAQCQEEFENALVAQVIEGMEADIPECMFESRIDEMVQDFANRLLQQGLNLESYLSYTGGDMSAFRASFREQAERAVKIRLALEEIGKLEKFEATEDEITAEYKRLCDTYSMDEERVRALIPAAELAKDVVAGKSIDIIKESAKAAAPAAKAAKPKAKAAAKPKADKAEKAEKAEKDDKPKKTPAKAKAKKEEPEA